MKPFITKLQSLKVQIWLHFLYYQDDVIEYKIMILEGCISINEISKDAITSMQLEGTDKKGSR